MLAATVGTTAAWAECRVAFAGSAGTPVVQYDPFRGEVGRARIALRLRVEDGSSPCQLGILAFNSSPGNTRQFSLGGGGLLYRLLTSDGIEIPNSGTGVGVPLNLVGADASEVTLQIEVSAGQIGPAGLYMDQLTLRLTDLSNGGVQLGPDVSALATAAIDSRAQVNIAGSSAAPASARFATARLDFGTLSQGEERSAIVQVRATAPVSISVTSVQGGVMRRARSPHNEPGLTYELILDGELLNLDLMPAAIQRTPPLQLEGGSYSLSVRITGDPTALPAGDYQDLLTIDVVPQ
jgi:hypothetical protein